MFVKPAHVDDPLTRSTVPPAEKAATVPPAETVSTVTPIDTVSIAPPADKGVAGESRESRSGGDPETEIPALARFDARGVCLVTLTVLAVLFALKLASDLVVPIAVAIVLAYALDPVVAFIQRARVPRVLATLIVMCSLLGIVTFGVLAMQQQVTNIVNTLPEMSSKISLTLKGYAGDKGSVIDKLKAASAVFRQDEPRGKGSRVVVEDSSKNLSSMILAGSMSVAAFLGQVIMVTFLVFFLLIGGNTFKRKFVKVAGQTLTQKKISVHMLDAINRSIQSYMLMMLVTNVTLGLCSWAAFKWIGLENAGTWAVVAGALHIIPYFGPVITALVTGAAAVLQFGLIGPGLLTFGVSLMIAALIGLLVTTWMTGRIAKMNVVAVFILLLLLTWLWGVWGTLLSIPIAFIIKVVSDHIEGMEAVSEFLAD